MVYCYITIGGDVIYMVVFSKQGKISEKDDKTNICHTFRVSDNAKKLIVKFSYFPKTVENEKRAKELVEEEMKKYGISSYDVKRHLPVKNLITLSFDECGEYRGACHRQPNEQTIVISNKNSSPGIFNRKLCGGEWNVVLNVHFAGCEIRYIIEIEEERK